jgi:hypothetical protein
MVDYLSNIHSRLTRPDTWKNDDKSHIQPSVPSCWIFLYDKIIMMLQEIVVTLCTSRVLHILVGVCVCKGWA